MVTVRVCSKLRGRWKLVVFTNKVGKNSWYFVGVFNKTIIPFTVVGYEMIIANEARRLSTISYPTRTRGIIVNYTFSHNFILKDKNIFFIRRAVNWKLKRPIRSPWILRFKDWVNFEVIWCTSTVTYMVF